MNKNYMIAKNNERKKNGEKFLRDTVDNLQDLLDQVTTIEIHGGEPPGIKLWKY